MSFAGGGSDMADYYRRFGGAVLSTAINKFIYVTVNDNFDPIIRLKYSKVEEVDGVGNIEHRLIREAMRLVNGGNGIEITSLADIPAKGTGLGSSSTYTVSLLHALSAYYGKLVGPESLARDACKVEIDLLGDPIGKQDQYAAAYGGMNLIRFHEDDSVSVQPVIMNREKKVELDSRLLMFYTGITRSATPILAEQMGNYGQTDKNAIMSTMVTMAFDLYRELTVGNIDAMGEILHQGWLLKKQMANGISNHQIDDWYEKARRAGAKGGKLLGAGGGGFLVFYAPVENHETIKLALSDLRPVEFNFESQGSRIIFVHE